LNVHPKPPSKAFRMLHRGEGDTIMVYRQQWLLC